MYDEPNGGSVTVILHFLNKAPLEWFTRKQLTVETANFGSEFVTARTATERIMETRHIIRYLGVPIIGPTILFGDNKSVVDSCAMVVVVMQGRRTAAAGCCCCFVGLLLLTLQRVG